MSFDLYLKPARFDREALGRYFAGRGNFRRRVEDGGATCFHYENPDTGVYFSFWLQEQAPEDVDPADLTQAERPPHILFNLNYFRSHVFGLEAEPEVAAFIDRFDCSIFDPQSEGMGEGPYDRDAFLHSYNAGNAFAYRAVLAKAKLRDLSREYVIAETEDIAAVWTWNKRRPSTQAGFQDARKNLFAPRLIWGRTKQSMQEVIFAIWAQDVPTAIPALATHVLLVRPQRGSLVDRIGAALKKGDRAIEARLAPMSALQGIRDLRWEQGSMGQFLNAPAREGAPPAIRELFSGPFRPPRQVIVSVAEDRVLDSHLVISARLGAGR